LFQFSTLLGHLELAKMRLNHPQQKLSSKSISPETTAQRAKAAANGQTNINPWTSQPAQQQQASRSHQINRGER
jgi:hypothetical protein